MGRGGRGPVERGGGGVARQTSAGGGGGARAAARAGERWRRACMFKAALISSERAGLGGPLACMRGTATHQRSSPAPAQRGLRAGRGAAASHCRLKPTCGAFCSSGRAGCLAGWWVGAVGWGGLVWVRLLRRQFEFKRRAAAGRGGSRRRRRAGGRRGENEDPSTRRPLRWNQ